MSVSGLGEVSSPLHQVLICGTAVLPRLRQFRDTVRSGLANKGPYTASIGGMKTRLPELQDDNKEAKKLRSDGLSEGWKDIEEVLHYQGLLYVLKVIRSELISTYHDDPLLLANAGLRQGL